MDGLSRVPSVVALQVSGELVAGDRAVQEARRDPERSEPRPKDYVVRGGDIRFRISGTDKKLRDETVSVDRALAATVELFVAEGRRFHGGRDPERLVLTCPAAWTAEQRGVLQRVAGRVLPGVPAEVMDEPVAAARYCALYDPDGEVAVGDRVAVHDLGAGTFDVAVLERTTTGFEVVERSGTEDGLGGNSFDHRVFEYVSGQLERLAPQWWARVRSGEDEQAYRELDRVEREVRRVREALSHQQSASAYVEGADVDVALTRAELEDLIGADVRRTVAVLRTAVDTACPNPRRLVAVYLTGGAGRTPLVERLVREAFPRARTWRDPKTVTAKGATHTVLEPLEEARRLREKRDREAKEKRDREAKEKRDREAKEKRDREAKEKRDREAKEKRDREREVVADPVRRFLQQCSGPSKVVVIVFSLLMVVGTALAFDVRDEPRVLDLGFFGSGLISSAASPPTGASAAPGPNGVSSQSSAVGRAAYRAVQRQKQANLDTARADPRMVALFPDLRPGASALCEGAASTSAGLTAGASCRGADGLTIKYERYSGQTDLSYRSPRPNTIQEPRSRTWGRGGVALGTMTSGRLTVPVATGDVAGELYAFDAYDSLLRADLNESSRAGLENRVLARLGSQ